MTSVSIGDMSRHFVNLNNTTRIKSALDQLTQELSTGSPSDMTRHLGGDRSLLGATDRDLATLEAYRGVSTAAAQRLDTMQIYVDRLDQARSSLVEDLMPINVQSPTNRLDAVSQTGLDDFQAMVGALNGRLGERSLFAGRSTDQTALADADTMLADLRTLLAGATDATDAASRISSYFEDSLGGFETSAYLGDAGADAVIRLSESDSITQTVRADDPTFRRLLAATAMVALSGDSGLSFSDETRAGMIETARSDLMTNASDIADVQSRIGANQAEIELVSSAREARATATSMLRNDLTTVDQYEVATRLQAVQQQLEMHYMMTARLSSLTLSEYLR